MQLRNMKINAEKIALVTSAVLMLMGGRKPIESTEEQKIGD